eukprot:GILJ01021712.1.p1 GENE.GILJ01021712.1~~GILJ01021712.1.p1  ORF type:complete len:100 (+),score=19.52 GILJ01021712.1:72-371(+)
MSNSLKLHHTVTGAGLENMTGCTTARYLGWYCESLDKPLERPTLNTGVILDDELTQLLQEDRRSDEMTRHRKQRDQLKTFMDEIEKYKAVTGGGRGKGK